MKRLFSFFFFFAALNIAQAQSKPTQRQFITLGGIESGSKVSIMQVLDYPVLVLADKNEKIKSYEVTILHDGNLSNTTSYKVEGAKFNQNVLNELISAKGKKGKIFIENIIVAHDNVHLKDQDMVFKFEE